MKGDGATDQFVGRWLGHKVPAQLASADLIGRGVGRHSVLDYSSDDDVMSSASDSDVEATWWHGGIGEELRDEGGLWQPDLRGIPSVGDPLEAHLATEGDPFAHHFIGVSRTRRAVRAVKKGTKRAAKATKAAGKSAVSRVKQAAASRRAKKLSKKPGREADAARAKEKAELHRREAQGHAARFKRKAGLTTRAGYKAEKTAARTRAAESRARLAGQGTPEQRGFQARAEASRREHQQLKGASKQISKSTREDRKLAKRAAKGDVAGAEAAALKGQYRMEKAKRLAAGRTTRSEDDPGYKQRRQDLKAAYTAKKKESKAFRSAGQTAGQSPAEHLGHTGPTSSRPEGEGGATPGAPTGHPGRAPKVSRRTREAEHLRATAAHLRATGRHDLAAGLEGHAARKEAKQLKRDVRKGRVTPGGQQPGGAPTGGGAPQAGGTPQGGPSEMEQKLAATPAMHPDAPTAPRPETGVMHSRPGGAQGGGAPPPSAGTPPPAASDEEPNPPAASGTGPESSLTERERTELGGRILPTAEQGQLGARISNRMVIGEPVVDPRSGHVLAQPFRLVATTESQNSVLGSDAQIGARVAQQQRKDVRAQQRTAHREARRTSVHKKGSADYAKLKADQKAEQQRTRDAQRRVRQKELQASHAKRTKELASRKARLEKHRANLKAAHARMPGVEKTKEIKRLTAKVQKHERRVTRGEHRVERADLKLAHKTGKLEGPKPTSKQEALARKEQHRKELAELRGKHAETKTAQKAQQREHRRSEKDRARLQGTYLKKTLKRPLTPAEQAAVHRADPRHVDDLHKAGIHLPPAQKAALEARFAKKAAKRADKQARREAEEHARQQGVMSDEGRRAEKARLKAKFHEKMLRQGGYGTPAGGFAPGPSYGGGASQYPSATGYVPPPASGGGGGYDPSAYGQDQSPPPPAYGGSGNGGFTGGAGPSQYPPDDQSQPLPDDQTQQQTDPYASSAPGGQGVAGGGGGAQGPKVTVKVVTAGGGPAVQPTPPPTQAPSITNITVVPVPAPPSTALPSSQQDVDASQAQGSRGTTEVRVKVKTGQNGATASSTTTTTNPDGTTTTTAGDTPSTDDLSSNPTSQASIGARASGSNRRVPTLYQMKTTGKKTTSGFRFPQAYRGPGSHL